MQRRDGVNVNLLYRPGPTRLTGLPTITLIVAGGMMAMFLLPGWRGPSRPPPPAMLVNGLPVSGSLAFAKRAGFDYCIAFTVDMRCRHQAVRIGEFGPYRGAVDLVGADGRGGFDHLTIWNDGSQTKLLEVGEALVQRGWRPCLKATSEGSWGDQKIYTRPGAPVRLSMDISYWGKRRLRIIPSWNRRLPDC